LLKKIQKAFTNDQIGRHLEVAGAVKRKIRRPNKTRWMSRVITSRV
jgi:hypothetical protein